MKTTTLRSRGFRLVKLTGNATMISHDKPFTINGKPAKLHNDYSFTIGGHYDKEIPHEIELI